MWRNPFSPVLTQDEREAAVHVQEWLQAVKQCATCHQWLPVGLFGGYGDAQCGPCFEQAQYDHKHAAGAQAARVREQRAAEMVLA